ncbi:MAG: hypothetical protein ACYC2R_08670 [Burkholderiales bacterium]
MTNVIELFRGKGDPNTNIGAEPVTDIMGDGTNHDLDLPNLVTKPLAVGSITQLAEAVVKETTSLSDAKDQVETMHKNRAETFWHDTVKSVKAMEQASKRRLIVVQNEVAISVKRIARLDKGKEVDVDIIKPLTPGAKAKLFLCAVAILLLNGWGVTTMYATLLNNALASGWKLYLGLLVTFAVGAVAKFTFDHIQNDKAKRWLLLAIIATTVAAFLTWLATLGLQAGAGGGSSSPDIDAVLASANDAHPIRMTLRFISQALIEIGGSAVLAHQFLLIYERKDQGAYTKTEFQFNPTWLNETAFLTKRRAEEAKLIYQIAQIGEWMKQESKHVDEYRTKAVAFFLTTYHAMKGA